MICARFEACDTQRLAVMLILQDQDVNSLNHCRVDCGSLWAWTKIPHLNPASLVSAVPGKLYQESNWSPISCLSHPGPAVNQSDFRSALGFGERISILVKLSDTNIILPHTHILVRYQGVAVTELDWSRWEQVVQIGPMQDSVLPSQHNFSVSADQHHRKICTWQFPEKNIYIL